MSVYVGGVGGVERSILEICRAFPRAQIDVYGLKITRRGFYPNLPNVRIHDLTSALARPGAGERRSPHYDLLIQYQTWLSRTSLLLDARLRLRIPAGDRRARFESLFDFILLESNADRELVRDPRKALTACPPVSTWRGEARRPAGIPEHFFFTLFNPYSPIKGLDDLVNVARKTPIPIVWGYSNTTARWIAPARVRTLASAGMIIPKEDLAPENIAYLYRHARAYVCFSRAESFGYSLADALRFRAPVVSRRVGALTWLPPRTQGVYLYTSRAQLRRLLEVRDLEPTRLGPGLMSAAAFRQRIEAVWRDWLARRVS